jgi:hypothetical protein
MTLAELNTALQSITGFKDKVAYRAFPVGKAPKLPFICYLATQTDNFDADNSVYHVLQGVDIELYTKDKSEATEQLIEAKLNEINLVWNKYEEWLDSEECYEIVYSITL